MGRARHRVSWFSGILLAALLGQAAWAADWPKLSPADFAGRPELDLRIDPVELDEALLNTAIFHETNRVRVALKLRAFLRHPKVDEAADLEARVGRVYRPPSHNNPFPLIGTPLERVKYVGLRPREVAENIALMPAYEVDQNVGVGVVVTDGQRRLVHPGTQLELRRATYRGFAAAVVQAWMESPGHRANLVKPTLLYLGCGVQPTVSLQGVDNLFCVQVFFTPDPRK